MLYAISCAGSACSETERPFQRRRFAPRRRGVARPFDDDRRRTSDVERSKLEDLLTRKFGVSGPDLDLLVKDATEAENEAVDLYRFTSVLKRQMSEDERIRVIENLWEIAFADGVSPEFEENLVWRVAELLGVNARDRISRKLSVAENKSAGRDNGG